MRRMSTFAKDNYSSVDIQEEHVWTAWRVLSQDSVDKASLAVLKGFIDEDPAASYVFLAVGCSEEELRYWGMTRESEVVEGIPYHLNHQAIQRSLGGDEIFVIDGRDGEKGSASIPM